jgi:hypothetical protein
MKNAKIPTAIKPPITAPAIAPGEIPDPPDFAIVLHITAAHEMQLCAVSSHRSLEEQLQTGVSVGQPCTHEESRANMSDPGTNSLVSVSMAGDGDFTHRPLHCVQARSLTSPPRRLSSAKSAPWLRNNNATTIVRENKRAKYSNSETRLGWVAPSGPTGGTEINGKVENTIRKRNDVGRIFVEVSEKEREESSINDCG